MNARVAPDVRRLRTAVLVWVDEPPRPDRPPPRINPPRHAEWSALAVYTRVAGRPRPKLRSRFHALNILIGAALLTIAAIVYHFEWDVALLRTITIAFGGVGLIALLKGLLGHEPSR